MNINKKYQEKISAFTRDGSLFVLVWLLNSRKSLLEDVIEELKVYYPDIKDIIYELESKSLISINIENGQKHLIVKNKNILDLLDVLSESLLRDYAVT